MKDIAKRFDPAGEFLRFTQPTSSDVHINAPLTNISIAYQNSGYIADMVFPTVQVVKDADYYYIYQMGDWFRDAAGVVAPGDAPKIIGYKLSSTTYSLKEYGIGAKVPDKIRQNADDALAPDRDATNLVSEIMMLKKEILIAALVMTQANWTYNLDVTGNWADPAASTFVTDIKTGIFDIKNGSGKRPNTLIIDDNTFDTYITENERIRDQMKYVKDDILTADMIAAFFRLDRCLIGSAMKTTALEKKSEATVALQNIWEVNADKGSAWLGYVAPSPGLRTPSAGYVFQRGGRTIEKTRDVERNKADFVDSREEYDEKVTGKILGKLFRDTYSS